MATTSDISRIPTNNMKQVLKELNLPAKLEIQVYHALCNFCEDPSHPERLDLHSKDNEAHVDDVFHDFLRTNGMALFSAVKGRGANRNPGPPVYRDNMNPTEMDSLFFVVRKALLVLSQERRKQQQHSDFQDSDSSKIAPSQAQSVRSESSVTEPTSASLDAPTTKLPSIVLSLSGYPRWASGNSSHHREARGVLDNPSITYSLGEGCTSCQKRGNVCTFRLSRSTCARCTAMGVNSSRCRFEESTSSNLPVQNETMSLLSVPEDRDTKEMDEATSVAPQTLVRRRAPENPRSATLNPAKRAISMLSANEDEPLQSATKRTTCQTNQPARGSRVKNQATASQITTTATVTKPFLPLKRVYVIPCVRNVLDQWSKWQYGHLSKCNTATLFEAVAMSYNIPNDGYLVAVEFRLADALMPEAVLVLRRAEDLQQLLEEIRERIMEQSYKEEFRVHMSPVMVALKEVEWLAIEM